MNEVKKINVHGYNEYIITYGDGEVIKYVSGYQHDIIRELRQLMDDMGYEFYKQGVTFYIV